MGDASFLTYEGRILVQSVADAKGMFEPVYGNKVEDIVISDDRVTVNVLI